MIIMEDKKERYIQRALNKAYFYLKFRPRTKKEVFDYLYKKSEKQSFLTEEIINAAIKKLEEQGLINDLEFISWYIEQRTVHKHKGYIAIKHELNRLGIDKEMFERYIVEHPVDQDEQAFMAIQNKWKRYIGLDRQKRFQKAAAYLSRRGFSFDVIKKTIAQLENSE